MAHKPLISIIGTALSTDDLQFRAIKVPLAVLCCAIDAMVVVTALTVRVSQPEIVPLKRLHRDDVRDMLVEILASAGDRCDCIVVRRVRSQRVHTHSCRQARDDQ
jgi:hypothetical protein